MLRPFVKGWLKDALMIGLPIQTSAVLRQGLPFATTATHASSAECLCCHKCVPDSGSANQLFSGSVLLRRKLDRSHRKDQNRRSRRDSPQWPHSVLSTELSFRREYL